MACCLLLAANCCVLVGASRSLCVVCCVLCRLLCFVCVVPSDVCCMFRCRVLFVVDGCPLASVAVAVDVCRCC